MPEEPKRVINTQSYFEQGVHTHTHHYAAKQNLAEAAAEIQQLLNHLAQTYPTTTEPEQQIFLAQFDNRTKAIPHIASILVAGGIEGIKLLCPPAGIPIEMARQLYEILMKNRERSQNG